MPGYLIVLIVLALILCVLLGWLAILDVLDERRAAARRQITEIRQEAEEAVTRLDASYRQALRDMHRHRG